MNLRFAIPLLLLAALLTGCSTPQSRAKEHPDLYNTLPPDTQARLQRGQIAVDDTKEMIYIALGRPDAVASRTDKSGLVYDLWIYTGVYYTRDTVWFQSSPFNRHLHDDDWFFHGPEYVDVQHEYERLRIEFENGTVKAFDQVQR